MKTDWDSTTFFKASEWPRDAAECLSPILLHEIFRLRERVPFHCRMTPSPVYEGHIRFKGGSRHSTDRGTRQPDASDLFLTSWRAAFIIWEEALQMNFGGIGLYTDTQLGGHARPMIHLDMRPERLMWVRSAEHGYVYFDSNPKLFLRILAG